jgi:hypothetical protein
LGIKGPAVNDLNGTRPGSYHRKQRESRSREQKRKMISIRSRHTARMPNRHVIENGSNSPECRGTSDQVIMHSYSLSSHLSTRCAFHQAMNLFFSPTNLIENLSMLSITQAETGQYLSYYTVSYYAVLYFLARDACFIVSCTIYKYHKRNHIQHSIAKLPHQLQHDIYHHNARSPQIVS